MDSDIRDEEQLAEGRSPARAMSRSFVVIPQHTGTRRDRKRWRESVEDIAERFSPFGRHFQVGQATNRSKWGIWTHGGVCRLYLEVAQNSAAPRESRCWDHLSSILSSRRSSPSWNSKMPRFYFDIVSNLLVRRSARALPKNRRWSIRWTRSPCFERLPKIGRNCSDRCWITEVNWPCGGAHSPAGKTVSVGEEEQADFLVRYYLLVRHRPCGARIWWRLIARGYRTSFPEVVRSLRRRPAWDALRTLIERVEGSTFEGPLSAPDGSYLYHFKQDDHTSCLFGWSLSDKVRASLALFSAVEAISRDGEPLPIPAGTEIVLGTSPVYYLLS